MDINGRHDRWMDGWMMDECMDGYMIDRWMDISIASIIGLFLMYLYPLLQSYFVYENGGRCARTRRNIHMRITVKKTGVSSPNNTASPRAP